jgi:hypothetical protein
LNRFRIKKPYLFIFFVAVVSRITAVFFSGGYLEPYEHFNIIEYASQLATADFNKILAALSTEEGWFVALHAVVFKFMAILKVNNPEVGIIVIRLMMALLTFHTIIAGYKIVNQLYNQRIAAFTGILLAGYWFVPWLSVRSMALLAAVPFFMTGLFFLNQHLIKRNYLLPFLTGILFSIGFLLAFDTWVFVLSLFITLLVSANVLTAILFGLAFSLSIVSVQVPVDLFNQAQPLFAIKSYFVAFFASFAIHPAWYLIIVLPLILMIPPVSFFLFRGLASSLKTLYYITVPAVFCLFASIFYAREAVGLMLFTIPFIVVAGSAGWVLFKEKSLFWKKHHSGYYLVLLCFWSLNFFLLPFASTLYTRQTEVEAMQYLSRFKPVNSFINEQTGTVKLVKLPHYYISQKCSEIVVNQIYTPDSLRVFLRKYPNQDPQFILFYGEKNLKNRIEAMYPVLPNISYVTSLEPGITERILNYFVRNLPAETIVVYRNNYYIQSPPN